MIWTELKNIDSSEKEIRKFAYTLGIFLVIVGVVISLLNKRVYPIPLVTGIVLLITGASFPKILLPIQKVWMGLAVILGFISTRIILSILYFIVLTPIAFVARLRGKDFLNERIEKNKTSYWNRRLTDSKQQNNLTKQY